jgi:hypothetical protein
MAKSVWYDKQMMSLISVKMGNAIDNSCEMLTDKVKASMKPGTGRTWPSKRPEGGQHQASIPGVAPAPDTEELQASISWASSTGNKGGGMELESPIYGGNVRTVVGKVGTTNFKGWIHELGWTINGDSRPFLRPTLANSEKEILSIITKEKL